MRTSFPGAVAWLLNSSTTMTGVLDGDLLVNASNNYNGFYPSHLTGTGRNMSTTAPYTVTAADWYTLQSVFYEDPATGFLQVDFNLLDSAGLLLHSRTQTPSGGTDVSTEVGGNRYGYLLYSTADNLALDNSVLIYAVPEPSSMLLFGAGTLALLGVTRLTNGRCDGR